MKKKKIIVTVLIIAILGVTAVLGWELYETNKVFEIDPLEMYGELDYLGPMEEEVEPLMEEEIKELNPIRMPYMEYDEGIDCTEIYGRFNTSKIENIYDAREAVSRALQYAGQPCDKDTLMYGNTSTTIQGTAVYEYNYFYKGVQCKGVYVGLWVDEEGNCTGVWFDWAEEDKVDLESVVPIYRGMKLKKVLNKRYGWCKIKHKWLNICRYGEEYGLEWRIELQAPKSEVYMIWMNANTGEIGSESLLGDVY